MDGEAELRPKSGGLDMVSPPPTAPHRVGNPEGAAPLPPGGDADEAGQTKHDAGFEYKAFLHAAALSGEEDREARTMALSTLQYMATSADNKRRMWEDVEGARAVFVAAAGLEEPQDEACRLAALGSLWSLAAEPTNRQAMWRDASTRQVVLLAAKSNKPEIRELALGVLWNLSPKAANAGFVWQNEAARAAILDAAKSPELEMQQARSFALAALQNMAEEPTNRPSMWQDELGARLALVEASKLSAPDYRELRGRAMGALTNLAVEPGNKESMWMDEYGARQALLEAANLAPDVDDKSRNAALTALWCLAMAQENRAPMWADAEVRSALSVASQWDTASSNGQLELPLAQGSQERLQRARERALGTLQHLSSATPNQKSMWEDLSIRNAILAAANLTRRNLRRLRVYGLGTLWNLSTCDENKVSMWQDAPEVRSAIIATLNDRLETPATEQDLRENAAAILWHLSTASSIRAALWADEEGARAILLATLAPANEEGDPTPSATAQTYALGAFRNLAEDGETCIAMWHQSAVRDAVKKAAASNDDFSVPPVKRALRLLCVWAYEPIVAADVYRDEGVTALLMKAAREEDREVGLVALRSFQALSTEATIKAEMWANAALREVLIDCSKRPDAKTGSSSSLNTLRNLTTDSGNLEGMWSHEPTRAALVEAALAPLDTDATTGWQLRSIALGALRNLAGCDANKASIWEDEAGARKASLEAASLSAAETPSQDASEAREHALALLRHLAVPHRTSSKEPPAPPAPPAAAAAEEGAAAEAEGVEGEAAPAPPPAPVPPPPEGKKEHQHPLWKGNQEVISALTAAAQLEVVHPSDRKARDHAIASLRHAV
eukprot:CAMPEP_0206497980 /NCGR_PEP_ID=MMETSP0324_2-20121206/50627_1 /ASSEMBLY_ACC=CAM_ASM_000836 /TAXON_ID=2866 /ORGANISM="Crypthecodinium cohnii, Strain Seligo" /LENGTH=845 /DNA_ID=CAMNT_0053983891 /DNA_START=214 /DNA_END=2751 /DNA_ORIENTATION=+